ncbi:hypothetical protein FOZ63_024782, partial [Perkinsus olseni]
TSPRGYPKGVQTERSVTALAQGLAYEVAAEVGEFLAEKEGDVDVIGSAMSCTIQAGGSALRKGCNWSPEKELENATGLFPVRCGRRAIVGIPKSSQTDLAADDPEDGVLWPKLSAY